MEGANYNSDLFFYQGTILTYGYFLGQFRGEATVKERKFPVFTR